MLSHYSRSNEQPICQKVVWNKAFFVPCGAGRVDGSRIYWVTKSDAIIFRCSTKKVCGLRTEHSEFYLLQASHEQPPCHAIHRAKDQTWQDEETDQK